MFSLPMDPLLPGLQPPTPLSMLLVLVVILRNDAWLEYSAFEFVTSDVMTYHSEYCYHLVEAAVALLKFLNAGGDILGLGESTLGCCLSTPPPLAGSAGIRIISLPTHPPPLAKPVGEGRSLI